MNSGLLIVHTSLDQGNVFGKTRKGGGQSRHPHPGHQVGKQDGFLFGSSRGGRCWPTSGETFIRLNSGGACPSKSPILFKPVLPSRIAP